METPKFDTESNSRMTRNILQGIEAGIASGMAKREEMLRDIKDTEAREDPVVEGEGLDWKDVEAMRARSVRIRVVEYPLECMRDGVFSPDEEALKTLLKEAMEIQSLKDDERIAGVISEIKTLLENISGKDVSERAG